MSAWLIAAISVLYLGAGIDAVINGKIALSLFCFGCVVANAGLAMMARG